MSTSHTPGQHLNLRLDRQLCFALYAATQSITRLYRTRLNALGITYPQYLVLLVLWEQDGPSVGQIGERLGLDSGTLTPLLKRLERDGLVERRRADHDERIVRIWLSERARALQAQVADVQRSVACDTGLPDGEQRHLREVLIALRLRMDESANGSFPDE